MKVIILLVSYLGINFSLFSQVLLAEDGSVFFRSDAPLELIEANCPQLRAAIRTTDNNFAFSLKVECFNGFNSALQKEHFDEKFMETHLYPNISFQGKIIEAVDWQKEGEYTIHAKGKFEVHGIVQERIIQAIIIVSKKKEITIEARFKVLLKDHNILIPSVVGQNIAEEIFVEAKINFHAKK
ncbi:MAG: YceI family protein [Bacteroidia bacterium]